MILTHSDSEAQICRALEQGARGYLLLGCSVQELINALRSVNAGGLGFGPLVVSRVADWMQHQALTPREEDVLRQLMLGLSNKGISRKLTLAVGTVKTHVKAVLRKLDATNRTEAVAIAQRRGILREEREWNGTSGRFHAEIPLQHTSHSSFSASISAPRPDSR
jgi:two-component system NarL family response regulator